MRRALGIVGLLVTGVAALAQSDATFAGWPSEFEGARLERAPNSLREFALARGFPGRVAHYLAGEKELVLRWSPQVTNTLRSVRGAFVTDGYQVSDGAPTDRGDGLEWACFEAKKGLDRVRVCERAWDEVGHAWTDFDDWLQEARAARTRPPWWASAVIEPIDPFGR